MELVALILATWFLTNLFMHQNGIFDVFYRIRQVAEWLDNKGITTPYNILACIYCASTWAGFAVALIAFWGSWGSVFLYGLALGAGSVFTDYLHDKISRG